MIHSVHFHVDPHVGVSDEHKTEKRRRNHQVLPLVHVRPQKLTVALVGRLLILDDVSNINRHPG